MIKILLFFVALTALAFGFAWLADQPGSVAIAFAGKTYEMDLVVALGFALATLVVAMILWSVLRFIFRIPTLMSLTARMRRRNKGIAALSRGMVAAGAGDAKTASRAARDAEKLMGDEPLALLLSAQAAQLSGDRAGAERVFRRMIDEPETRLLGLRGLHAEARRQGDDAAADEYARRAHEIAPVPWAGQAMLERRALSDDWRGALAVVEDNLSRKAISRAEAARQRAVLKTAMAEQIRERDPVEALALAREAIKLAPDLTPASALAGALLAKKGDLRRAARILEASWKRAPHPELARVYIELRHGDVAGDRLNRAKALGRIAPGHPESQLAIARAALEARQYDLARRTMADLLENGRRPTVRMCLVMADIEETEHGPTGLMREWLSRAARAPRDPAWVADGIVSDRWLPASPVTGQIDAFRWETPLERLGGPAEDATPQIWPDPANDLKTIESDVVEASALDGKAGQILPPASASSAAAANAAAIVMAARAEPAASAPAPQDDAQKSLDPTVNETSPGAAHAKEAPETGPAPQAAAEPEKPEAASLAAAVPPQPAAAQADGSAAATEGASANPDAGAPAASSQTGSDKAPADHEPADQSPPGEAPPRATATDASPSEPAPAGVAAGEAASAAPAQPTTKAPLPDHILTAPDDPGPDDAPPPAPRKRGLFG